MKRLIGGFIVGSIHGSIKGQTTETGFLRGAIIGGIVGAIAGIQLLDSPIDGEPFSKVSLLYHCLISETTISVTFIKMRIKN